MEKKPRYLMIDYLRGIAVVLMVFFHFVFDLSAFGVFQIDFNQDFFWFWLPRLIVFLFLICVGMSQDVIHKKGFQVLKFFKRIGKLVLGALAITIVTYYLFPKRFVYFGTLHCIASVSLIAPFFIGRYKLSFFLFVSILASFFMMKGQVVFPSSGLLNGKSMDFIPFYPWVAIMFLGIFLKGINFHRLPLPFAHFKIQQGVCFLGRHSLLIYLLHQPILYGAVWGYFTVFA